MRAMKTGALLALFASAAAVAAPPLRADKNGDGTVSLEEYQQAASAAAAERFARLDANGDGQLTADELQAGRRHGPRGPRGLDHLLGPDGQASIKDLEARMPNVPAERWQALDANHDGVLTREELEAGRGQMAARMLKRLDTDGDGKLSLVELQAVRPNMTAEEFNRLDVNGDGLLSPDELPRPGTRGRRFGPPPAPPAGADPAQ